MKFLKQLLDLLHSIVKAWPSLILIAGWLISGILWLVRIGQTTIDFTLPLSIVIVIVTLVLYSITKVAQSLFQQHPFEYSGLRWRPSLLGHVHPICPIQDCGQKVFPKAVAPPPVQVVRPSDWGKVQMTTSYQYECPTHGRIDGVPNWPPDELRSKAKAVQRKSVAT